MQCNEELVCACIIGYPYRSKTIAAAGKADMADRLSPQQRSAAMAAVRSSNTKPELTVRCALHEAGFRFRLHAKNLPGRPDIVLPRFRMVIFVHGCFWHAHHCPRGKRPSTNVEFWTTKIDSNIRRDRAAIKGLRNLGWRIRTLWACSLKASVPRLLRELQRDLRRSNSTELAK